MKGDSKPMRLGQFDSRSLNKERWVLGQNPDESIIEPEILPAVKAIRQSGIETMSSSTGLSTSPLKWGSFVLLNLDFSASSRRIVDKISKFASAMTAELQRELRNPNITLQLVSAEKWNENQATTSIKAKRYEFYRLQLKGGVNDEEIKFAWNKVAEKFNKSVVE